MKIYVCVNCGVLRRAEIDQRESEVECQDVTKDICPVCSCPHVERYNESN